MASLNISACRPALTTPTTLHAATPGVCVVRASRASQQVAGIPSTGLRSRALPLALPGAHRRPAWRSGAVCAAVKWVLEPVGDGDSGHLDEAVDKPGVIELVGDAFVLGRVADRSDIVINVPTVSGSHARLERKGEALVVTDLNSTNGTFIGDERLKPGSPVEVPNGAVLTFGDQHLAMFKAQQTIEAVDV